MSWLSWSNPVAIWWGFLLAVSAINIGLLLGLYSRAHRRSGPRRTGLIPIEPLLLLGTAYVLGCAFRSVLPRADVQRICLFDTPLSSVLIGRSVATVAELCFIVQWAIVLRTLATLGQSDTAKNVARAIVPLIVLAEGCSWYAVITTDYLGNVCENSLWAAAFLLVGVALIRIIPRFRGIVQLAVAATALGIAAYFVFMAAVNVPMYFVRWQADLDGGRQYLGLAAGMHDLATHWIVTRDFAQWRQEMLWMSLYFSVAVWMSLALAAFPLIEQYLPRYRTQSPPRGLARRPLSVPLGSS